jgi:hypothetical protein
MMCRIFYAELTHNKRRQSFYSPNYRHTYPHNYRGNREVTMR